jgi:putative addiction module component (TIGR02574 family)
MPVALELPPDQRLTLAYRLLLSVDPESESGTEAAWEAEITARIARFDAGESHAVPAAEAFARLRENAALDEAQARYDADREKGAPWREVEARLRGRAVP